MRDPRCKLGVVEICRVRVVGTVVIALFLGSGWGLCSAVKLLGGLGMWSCLLAAACCCYCVVIARVVKLLGVRGTLDKLCP